MNEITALIYQYKHYGFSYCFKKFMNPNRTYKELESFVNEYIYSTSNPQIQSLSTLYITGIDEIDLVVFIHLLDKEAANRGFNIEVKEDIVASPIDDNYHPQYFVYHFNEIKIVITTAGCDFNIEQYLKKKNETGE